MPDRPGIAAAIFGPLADAHISVDTIVQNSSLENLTDLTFTVGQDDLPRAMEMARPLAAEIGAGDLTADDKLGKVSIVGTGMQNTPGYAALMFRTLADSRINIQLITTSEIRITCIIAEQDVVPGRACPARGVRAWTRPEAPLTAGEQSSPVTRAQAAEAAPAAVDGKKPGKETRPLRQQPAWRGDAAAARRRGQRQPRQQVRRCAHPATQPRVGAQVGQAATAGQARVDHRRGGHRLLERGRHPLARDRVEKAGRIAHEQRPSTGHP